MRSHVYRFCGLVCLLVFACGGGSDGTGAPDAPAPVRNTVGLPAFDASRAFGYLERQVAFGPRVPGFPGHERTKQFLRDTLQPLADRLILQSFTASSGDKSLALTNIIGVFEGAGPSSKRLLLGAHWDTRPVADRDASPGNWTRPIPGANDGASGVAALLEIAQALSARRPGIEVVIVLFDGEDYGGVDRFDFSLGATHFVDEMGRLDLKPDWMILVDMIGDRDLDIRMEPGSTLWLSTRIWIGAAELGLSAFVPESYPGRILDDHTPFLGAGVDAVDLIDFTYPYWHTMGDTVDKCSPASLKQVGDILLCMTYRELR